MFKGSFVAIITPFKDGKIDEKKLQELVEWHISEKTNGLVPCGTTGESATLSYEEHYRVIELVVKQARKRVPVIAGAGSNATHEAVEITQKAEELGADAILSVNPYYNKPSQEGMKQHFGAVAKSTKLPIMLYNLPGRTSVQLSVDSIVWLAEKFPNITAVKESTGTTDVTSEVIARLGKKFTVISGDDSMTLPLMSIGASGVVSVIANLVPREVSEMCAAVADGDWVKARDLHLRLFPLIKAAFLDTNPQPIKAMMKEAGLLESDEMRLPMVPCGVAVRNQIKAAMQAFGVKAPVKVEK